MMSDDPRPDSPGGGGNISLAISVNDPAQAKQLFESLQKDGSVIMPLGKTYWAEAFGMLTDKFGIRWMVNCESSS
jgi:PhnB protein